MNIDKVIDAAIPGLYAFLATAAFFFLWGFLFPKTSKQRQAEREARAEIRRIEKSALSCYEKTNSAKILHFHQKKLSIGVNPADLEKRIITLCSNPVSSGLVYSRLMQPWTERIVDVTGMGEREIWKLTPFGEVVVRVLNEKYPWKAKDSFLLRGTRKIQK